LSKCKERFLRLRVKIFKRNGGAMKKERILIFLRSLRAHEVYSLASLLEAEFVWTYQRNTTAINLAKRIVDRFSKEELISAIKEDGLEYLYRRYL
jgi:hypothetical protein